MKKFKALFSIAVAVALGMTLFAGCGDGENNDNDGNDVCEHTTLSRVDRKDATCYEEGNYAHYKCDGCGALFSDRNGTNSTTLEDVTIGTVRHDMHRYEEQVGNYSEYYFCNSCGRYYQDLAGSNEIPYDEFTDSSVTPADLPDGWTDPAGADALTRNFTIRCFVGWDNSDGKDFTHFPDDGTVWINVNLNRKVTLSGDGWYNFGIAYNKADGFQYKDFGVGHLTKASEFTELFVQNGGIWVRIVRDGTNCSFYFEDKYGIPIFISSNADFQTDEALYRFALGNAEQVSGWTKAAANAEICWNIANPRCVFSKK